MDNHCQNDKTACKLLELSRRLLLYREYGDTAIHAHSVAMVALVCTCSQILYRQKTVDRVVCQGTPEEAVPRSDAFDIIRYERFERSNSVDASLSLHKHCANLDRKFLRAEVARLQIDTSHHRSRPQYATQVSR